MFTPAYGRKPLYPFLAACTCYQLSWLLLPETWLYLRGVRVVVFLAVLGLMLALAETIHRYKKSIRAWPAYTLFSMAVPLSPLFILSLLFGWGARHVVPNEKAYSVSSAIPHLHESLAPAFKETRLIVHQNQSIAQGTSYVLFALGTPHAEWAQTFQAIQKPAWKEYRACSLIGPPAWGREDCSSWGLPGEWSCFSCPSGNWNHNQHHALIFNQGGTKVLYSTGSGLLYQNRIRQRQVIDQDPSFWPYRYPPATSPLDSGHAIYYQLLRSTDSFNPVFASLVDPVIHLLLMRNDQSTLRFLAERPGGRDYLRRALVRGIPF